jgi:hypothetical protein
MAIAATVLVGDTDDFQVSPRCSSYQLSHHFKPSASVSVFPITPTFELPLPVVVLTLAKVEPAVCFYPRRLVRTVGSSGGWNGTERDVSSIMVVLYEFKSTS